MMKIRKVVAGLLKQNCHRILRGISLILFLFTLFLIVGAQALETGRIIGAVYDEDNNLLIHVDMPDNQVIVGANLLFDNEQLSLELEAEPLPVEHWFILDSGVSMINSYSLVADELRRLSELANSNIQFAGVLLAETASVLEPADSSTEFNNWLDDYQISATQSCVLDALHEIPQITDSARIARRIVVITGSSPDSGACADNSVNIGYPIDFVVIGNQVDSLYADVAGQTGGRVTQTSVLNFQAEMSLLPDRLSHPVFALSIPMLETINSAEIMIDFEDGNSVRQTIFPYGEVFIPPTATQTVTPFPSTATPDSETATASSIPASDTPTAEATNLSVSATEATEELIVIPATETTIPEATDSEPPVSNSVLIAGGGVAAVVVVLIVMALLLGMGRRRSQSKPDPVVDTDSTILPGISESQLDSTQAFTMRQIASQLGPTLVANLVNKASDTIYEIHRPVSILGRQINSDILIAGDNQISREHVRFTTRDDGTIWIVRLTRNPILVNGLPMETTRQLFDGDVIQLSPDLQVIFTSVSEEEQE